MKFWSAVLCAAFILGACASYQVNPKLDHYDARAGYRFDNLSAPGDPDALFVILTFSGGGTRAAALSYGILEKLRDSRIRWQGEERSLLDEVDVISSVSGGSFTAAYFGLFGDRIFADFEERFLYRNIEGELKGLLLSPGQWIKLISPEYTRTDMAVDFYDREIFQGRRFSNLVQKASRPFVMINATDMTMGSRFTFIQDQFDPICSNLDGVAVAKAVTASSCFPVAFAPLTLNNYAGQCQFQEPPWVGSAMEDLQLNPSRFRRAQTLRSYTDGAARPYLHLLDGGVADNIGLRGPLEGILSNDPAWSILNKIDLGKVTRLLVIAVDAKTDPAVDFDRSSRPPGLVDVLTKTSTLPMDNYSFDTIQTLRNSFKAWGKDQLNYTACRKVLSMNQCSDKQMPYPPPTQIEIYPVYIGFDQIVDPKLRNYFQSMATSFNLPDQQIDDLRKIGPELLEQSAEFKALMKALSVVDLPK